MFLFENNILERSYYEKNGKEIEGTLHYDYFEISSLFSILEMVYGLSPDQRRAFTRKNNEPGSHDALVDCHNQLREINLCLDYITGQDRQVPDKSQWQEN